MFKDQTPILLTRQLHYADRAGRHYDIRLVLGDKAYSWATRKDMPAVGEAIALYEQPVHTAEYAMRKRIVIPKGNYGSGTTTLDFVRKAVATNSDGGKDKFVLTVPESGERYLFIKFGGQKGNTWMLKNLGEKKLDNKYIEKASSLLAGAAITHLAQNLATKAALSSKHVSKYLANSFSQGAKGVVDTSFKAKATRFLSGAITPDIAIAHKKSHELGSSLKPLLDGATNKQKVGLRMMTEGRFSDLKKYNLHNDPVIQKAHAEVSKSIPLPSLSKMVDKAQGMEPIFNDKKHPLVSNIVKGISRGDNPVGPQFKSKSLGSHGAMAGALSSIAIDPAGGALNTTKALMSSKTFNSTRIGHKITKKLENQFVINPIRSGMNVSATDGGSMAKLKDKIYEYGVNPVSANIKRTSGAVSDVLKD